MSSMVSTTGAILFMTSHAAQAGVGWIGINGGGSEDYIDSQGRVWYPSNQKWTPDGWGGYTDVSAPKSYTNNWGNPRFKCQNWPTKYTDKDYDELLHKYSQESASGEPQTFRINLQEASAEVKLYTVTWQFCEKNFHGGAPMNFSINGKLVKDDYISKHHHTHTDIYKWTCVPTAGGKIELQIHGKNWEKGNTQSIQARFSTLEFELSSEGCETCKGLACNQGFGYIEEAFDKNLGGAMGNVNMANTMQDEIATTSLAACACGVGISGENCEIGKCALVSCNEPLGGMCINGACSCLNGHTGKHCETAPNTDDFGCYTRRDANQGKLEVHTLCLPEQLAGPANINNIFRGPSPMHAVADRVEADLLYVSWTADRLWGKTEDDGRVYVSKVRVAQKQPPVLEKSVHFDGFVRTGGIDITEEGTIATLCSKYKPEWVTAFVGKDHAEESMAPMVLAVCQVDSSTMTTDGVPWRIGKQYQPEDDGSDPSVGGWGNYPISGWFPIRSAGYGYLTYAPEHKKWSAWYGATVGGHTGFAMHTYDHNAEPVIHDVYEKYAMKVARDKVESRVEDTACACSDHHRRGTGDHQGGAAWSYHSGIGDIGLMKHTHGYVYMQQYGLADPTGKFAPPGHSTGRLELVKGSDAAILEGGLRQCGDGWILAIITKEKGNVCAKVDKEGNIGTWESIERSVGNMPCAPNGDNCGDGRKGGMNRLAPLGTSIATTCDASTKFLYGYEKEDRTRWLVEIDGNCKPVSERLDVTESTTWPLYQDWTTTASGAVAWVTSWRTDHAGNFGPKGSPNSISYEAKPAGDFDGYKFGFTPEATNEAKITVYYPNAPDEFLNSSIPSKVYSLLVLLVTLASMLLV